MHVILQAMNMLACSLFIQILSVQKISNRGTNALPILNQALTSETECCDHEQLIHPAQPLQFAYGTPTG
jgi:hypothetical protein